MVRLIPEKTVELWTAFALLDYLGQGTWVWSPTSYEDQDVWTEDLKKFFMLELKAPEGARNRPITINRIQLDRYVDAYRDGQHPDVIYVLPDPVWMDPPRRRHPFRFGRWPPWSARPSIRHSFASWSYVIRATALQELVGGALTSGMASKCTVRCSAERPPRRARVTWLSGDGHPQPTWKYAVPLSKFLLEMRLCTEPVGTAMRRHPLKLRTATVRARVRTQEEGWATDAIPHEDLRLEGRWMRWEVETTRTDEREEQESPTHLLYVGLPRL